MSQPSVLGVWDMGISKCWDPHPQKNRDLPCENAWNMLCPNGIIAGIIVEEISRSNCQIPSHTSQKSTFVQGGPLLVLNGVIIPISRVITPVARLSGHLSWLF